MHAAEVCKPCSLEHLPRRSDEDQIREVLVHQP